MTVSQMPEKEPTISDLIDEIRSMRETIDSQVTLLQMIKEEVGPVIARIEGNSMFRMMFGGGK